MNIRDSERIMITIIVSRSCIDPNSKNAQQTAKIINVFSQTDAKAESPNLLISAIKISARAATSAGQLVSIKTSH